MLTLRETLPIGRYSVLLFGGARVWAERRPEGWFLVDGTGWIEAFDDEIVEANPC